MNTDSPGLQGFTGAGDVGFFIGIVLYLSKRQHSPKRGVRRENRPGICSLSISDAMQSYEHPKGHRGYVTARHQLPNE
jgi:hypothetical protein